MNASACAHPERRLYIKGKCRSCYDRDWDRTPKGRASQRRRNARYRAIHPQKVYYRLKVPARIKEQTACQICGKDKQLVIDHEHGKPFARGRLCANCNRSLGFVENSLKRGLLTRMVLYVDTGGTF